MLLIKQSGNYADEFDLEGFMVIPEKTWEEIKEGWKEFEYPHNSYFGSNEFITFESPEDILDSFEVIELTTLEEAVLVKLFNGGKATFYSFDFGVIKIPEY